MENIDKLYIGIAVLFVLVVVIPFVRMLWDLLNNGWH